MTFNKPYVGPAPTSDTVPAPTDWGQLVRHVGPISTDYQVSVRIDEVNESLAYVGTAPIGSAEASAVWAIKQIATVGTVLSIKWAHGGASDQIWTARAGLTYT
jgi:hypothetical protein